MLSGRFTDPYNFHHLWNKDYVPSLQKSLVIDMFRRRAMGVSIYKLQNMREFTVAHGIELAIARVYCYLHSVWPSREVRGSRIEDKAFDCSVSYSFHQLLRRSLTTLISLVVSEKHDCIGR